MNKDRVVVSRRSSEKRKKIILAVLAVIAILISSIAIYTSQTDSGKNLVSSATEQFKPVRLPESSLDLTKVPEPEVNKVDKLDDKHVNVDMNGKKITQDIRPGTPETKEKRERNRGNDSSRVEDNGVAYPDPEKMKQVSNTGKRFIIDSVGLNVPLGSINEVDNLIKPTNYTSAFTIRNRGVPYWKTNEGTAYIVMHALDEGGIAPGNFIIDPETKKSRVEPGAQVKVGSKTFTVDKSMRVGKGLITKDEDIWSNKKWRLVIITCFPNSNDNQVVIAHRNR